MTIIDFHPIDRPKEYLTRTKGNSYQAEALPYLDIELEKKYGSLNFRALPEGQKFNTVDSAITLEVGRAAKEILSEKPYLSLTDSSSNVKISYVAIRFIKDEAFFKFRIENSDTAEFLTGAMQLGIVKKDGKTLDINANYISSFPIVQTGKEFYILYAAKNIAVNNEDSFSFELNDRLKRYKFKITIPGTVYNKEKSKV